MLAVVGEEHGGIPAVRRAPLPRLVTDDKPMAPADMAEAFAVSRPLILRYLRARGAGDHAEDLLQDLWVRIDRDESAVTIDNPRAYLFRAAHNLMLDQAREQRRRAAREETFHSDAGHSADHGEEVIIARDTLARVQRALHDLGPRTETIFRRHRLDGIAQRQIAAELGVTLSAIEKQLQRAYRAIANLQRALDREDGPSIDGGRETAR